MSDIVVCVTQWCPQKLYETELCVTKLYATMLYQNGPVPQEPRLPVTHSGVLATNAVHPSHTTAASAMHATQKLLETCV